MGSIPTILKDVCNVNSRKRGFQEIEGVYNETGDRVVSLKKKVKTSQYIFEHFFEKGYGSDVTIKALDHEWKLHKLHLVQSPYFSAMFSGFWVESSKSELNIHIEDSNITVEGLDIVFSSLYRDEIAIAPLRIVPVVGAALLFQLDDLIKQCENIMREHICVETVIEFYEASTLYNFPEVRKASLFWLYANLMTAIINHPLQMQKISTKLMMHLLSSEKTLVIETEFSMYKLLKNWMYLKLHKDFVGSIQECSEAVKCYFPYAKDGPEFLLQEIAAEFVPVFSCLRLKNLVDHLCDIAILEQDNIIPKDWLTPFYKENWLTTLSLHHGSECGPRDVTDAQFMQQSVRCGYRITNSASLPFLWKGYKFGVEFVIQFFTDNRILKLVCHVQRNSNNTLLHPSPRYLKCCFVLYKCVEKGHFEEQCSSGIKTVELQGDTNLALFHIPPHVSYPWILKMNFLLVSLMAAGGALKCLANKKCIHRNSENQH